MLDDPLYVFTDALDQMVKATRADVPLRVVRAQMDDALTWQWVDVKHLDKEGFGRVVAEVMLEAREVFPGRRVRAVVYSRAYSPQHHSRARSGTSATEEWDYSALLDPEFSHKDLQDWLDTGLDRGWRDALEFRARLSDEIREDRGAVDRSELAEVANQLRQAMDDWPTR